MAERDNKRRKTSHSWLDLEAQVTLEGEEDEDVWEIGMLWYLLLGIIRVESLTDSDLRGRNVHRGAHAS